MELPLCKGVQMEIVKGVNLHLLKKKQFKTVHIKLRFSSKLNQQSIAKRVLVAQMLELATQKYDNNQLLRLYLAHLDGANLSTQVKTIGKTHCVDINLSFLSEYYRLGEKTLLKQITELIKEILYHPISTTEQYKQSTFEIEKQNVLTALDNDEEDIFYLANQQLKSKYYTDPIQALPSLSNRSLLEKENSYTAYQEFKRMIQKDRIDIFVVGDFIDYDVIKYFLSFPFKERNLDLQLLYKQDIRPTISQTVSIKDCQQSVLVLGYHIPYSYGDSESIALAIYNAILGELPSSKLFVNIREKKGLVYTIGTHYNLFSNLYSVYAGIKKEDKNRVLSLILKQIKQLRLGRFTEKDVKQAKLLLKSQLLITQDNPESIIEKCYLSYYFKEFTDVDTILTMIDNISKSNIIKIAQSITLQTVHILEGE